MPDLDHIKKIRSEAECLLTESQIAAALDDMARRMTEDLGDRNPILCCVMNGGIYLTGQLLPRLQFPLEVDYIHATRYRESTSGDELEWRARPQKDFRGRVLVVIDDILDEGITLAAILKYFRAEGAAEVRSAVLVDKLHQRKFAQSEPADYCGLNVPDRYVFGCGMDYKGYWRNLPAIYAVRGL
jgi:hypoxanthine phosphoribosyltransferase